MFYQLYFKLWDEIDEETLKVEKRPVGKLYISAKKLTKPARWRQLWLEDTAKPQKMKIWYDKHSKYFSSLENFEEDDVEDFAGYDMIESPDLVDEDDTSWLFPPKGPGEFKKLRNKKKKKGKKKNKQKKSEL